MAAPAPFLPILLAILALGLAYGERIGAPPGVDRIGVERVVDGWRREAAYRRSALLDRAVRLACEHRHDPAATPARTCGPTAPTAPTSTPFPAATLARDVTARVRATTGAAPGDGGLAVPAPASASDWDAVPAWSLTAAAAPWAAPGAAGAGGQLHHASLRSSLSLTVEQPDGAPAPSGTQLAPVAPWTTQSRGPWRGLPARPGVYHDVFALTRRQGRSRLRTPGAYTPLPFTTPLPTGAAAPPLAGDAAAPPTLQHVPARVWAHPIRVPPRMPALPGRSPGQTAAAAPGQPGRAASLWESIRLPGTARATPLDCAATPPPAACLAHLATPARTAYSEATLPAVGPAPLNVAVRHRVYGDPRASAADRAAEIRTAPAASHLALATHRAGAFGTGVEEVLLAHCRLQDRSRGARPGCAVLDAAGTGYPNADRAGVFAVGDKGYAYTVPRPAAPAPATHIASMVCQSYDRLADGGPAARAARDLRDSQILCDRSY